MTLPYLEKRDSGRYYLRFRIPKDMQVFSDLFGVKDVIRHSLRTKDRNLAKVLVHSQMAKYELVMALLRSGLLPIEQLRRMAEALLKGYVSDVEKSPRRVLKKTQTDTAPSPRLSHLVDLYIHEHGPTWGKKTKAEYTSEFKVLVRLIGDRPARDITREACVVFRDALLQLPPNASKLHALQSKSLRQIAAMKCEHPMSAVTANKYLVLLSSLLNWAVKQDYVARNPAEGLKIPIRRRASSVRSIYTQEDLQRVVDHLPRSPKAPEQFWIPLIAMYSGMRQGEICQLESKDVREVENILCFDVNAERGKELKTPASVRLVPVHPVLLQLGFREYAQAQKQPQLWSNLAPDDFGYWTREFSRWYRSFNREFVTEDPKKCFHSFRHTFADQLKQIGVQDLLISELLGHANPNISTGRYGKPYHVATLYDAVKRVDYGLKLLVN